jgi:unconventional prefoldin RPB5 interactor 1
MSDSTLIDLERHRLLLETQVAQLRKSLQTWQLWSAEYEGLKEEIQSIPAATIDDLLAIGRDFNGQLVTLVEIDDILYPNDRPRSADQVVNLLDRRIDYVSQNVKTAEKQLQAAEEKLEKVGMVTEDLEEGTRDEEGLPLTEITEELDEEGNVISWKTSTPGTQKGQLLDVLRQAGVTEEDMAELAGKSLKSQKEEDAESMEPNEDTKTTPAPAEPSVKEVLELEVEDTITPSAAKNQKKGVSFTADTKPGPDNQQSKTSKRIEEIMSIAKSQNLPLPSDGADAPIVPSDESAEDAQMRKEMLQYGMSEIGAVVAELELESGSEWSDEDEGYDDEFSDDDDDDEEDQYGRSTRQVVDEKVHQRMRALEEKLGVRGMMNLGPKPPADVSLEKSTPEAGVAQIKITQEAIDAAAKLQSAAEKKDKKDAEKPAKKPKKGVRFSEDIDISPPPQVPQSTLPVRPKPTTIPAPISDIIERAAPASIAAPAPPTAKRVSKFKSSRQAAAPMPSFLPPTFVAPRSERTVPTGPANATLAPQVVERASVVPDSVAEPDELDPALLQQEVVAEYHKVRNRMIQREGGFGKQEENVAEDGTILEEEWVDEEGRPKRVSRFMAARLARG